MPWMEAISILGAMLLFMSAVFLLALWKRNNGFADVAWGLVFVLGAWLSFFWFGEGSLYQWLATLLVTLWGLRLAIHIGLRNWGKPEDYRYAAWRKEWGVWAPLRSFFQVFLLQGLFAFLILSPVLWINIKPFTNTPGFFALLGILLWSLGFFFETVGDWQLTQFLKTKKPGELMTSGLWSLTRHPNYFGEVTQWWGLYIFTLGVPFASIFIISPLLITGLILFVSGIPMLEKKYEGRPDWEAYASKTNAFFPKIKL